MKHAIGGAAVGFIIAVSIVNLAHVMDEKGALNMVFSFTFLGGTGGSK